jgi:hypothetical protein
VWAVLEVGIFRARYRSLLMNVSIPQIFLFLIFFSFDILCFITLIITSIMILVRTNHLFSGLSHSPNEVMINCTPQSKKKTQSSPPPHTMPHYPRKNRNANHRVEATTPREIYIDIDKTRWKRIDRRHATHRRRARWSPAARRAACGRRTCGTAPSRVRSQICPSRPQRDALKPPTPDRRTMSLRGREVLPRREGKEPRMRARAWLPHGVASPRR